VNSKHLAKLKEGVDAWNRWRQGYDGVPRLSGAVLSGLNLDGIDLRRAELYEADLSRTSLRRAGLPGADLQGANLDHAVLSQAGLGGASLYGARLEDADLSGASLHGATLDNARCARANLTRAELVRARLDATDLTGAIMTDADLTGAGLYRVRLTSADLTGATLSLASLVETDVRGARLIKCKVYGVAAWDLTTDETTVQSELAVATAGGRTLVMVDDLEVAQFIYMLTSSEKVRRIIGTLEGSRGVLIIGRFSDERIEILRAIGDELRARHDLFPIMFDFEPQRLRTTIETLLALAHMSRFVVADLTEAQAVVQELTKITDTIRSLPIKLIIHEQAEMPSMSDSFLIADSVLKPVYRYRSREQLRANLQSEVIDPAQQFATAFEARLAALRREYTPWQRGTADES
jgi:uncharacterized protein YjbI with pentapeptide repeats